MRAFLFAVLAAGAAVSAQAQDRPSVDYSVAQPPGVEPKIRTFVFMLPAIPSAECREAERRASERQGPKILGQLPPGRLQPAGALFQQGCILPADQGQAQIAQLQFAPPGR